MGNIPKVEILNVKLSPLTYHFLLNSIFRSEDKGFATLNSVHGIIESQNSQLIKDSINNSTFALCDGRPLYWVLKNKFTEKFDHITGRVLMHKICQRAEKENKSIGIYGGLEKNQEKCIDVLSQIYPKLKIDFVYAPPLMQINEKENKDIINQINQSKVKYLFVCLGCPKQEVWMNNHYKELNCFLLGVGAALDYIAGAIKPPPKIITNMGLEWLVRLLMEPKRLFKRYFYIVPIFIYLMIKQKFN